MSPLKASAACVSTVGDVGLPSEPTEFELFGARVPGPVRPAGDAVAVLVLRVGRADDVGFGDRFEQADADHLRGQSGRDRAGRRRAGRRRVDSIVYVGDRSEYSVPSAYSPGISSYVITSSPSAGTPRIDAVLQLVAVDRVRAGRPTKPSSVTTDSRSSSPSRPSSRRSGLAAPVEQVARRTRLGVEGRPETVASVGRCRGRHPVLGEEAVADLEGRVVPRWSAPAPAKLKAFWPVDLTRRVTAEAGVEVSAVATAGTPATEAATAATSMPRR